jgi:hypothetical protein
MCRNPGKTKRVAEMPTEIAPSSTPSAGRAKTPEINSRDIAPLSITALTIIAILVVVLHLVGATLLDRSQAHALAGVPDDGVKCATGATPQEPSLPFD